LLISYKEKLKYKYFIEKSNMFRVIIRMLEILILHEIFLVNLLKKFVRKYFFFTFFSKNFNQQVILSWIIIFYKIIKFVSISYKIYYEQYFIQNILQKKLVVISCKKIFYNKIYKYFLRKKFQNKIDKKYNFFFQSYKYFIDKSITVKWSDWIYPY